MGMESGHEVEHGSISMRRGLAIALALLASLGLIALTVLVTNSNSQRDAALAAQRESFEIIILTRSLVSSAVLMKSSKLSWATVRAIESWACQPDLSR